MENKIKAFALDYLKRGISIIPVAKDKKPLIKWQVFQERLATVEEVEQWFIAFPDAQIGIVTGKISGLIVVDIDSKDMDRNWLPATSIVQTGSGGYHYYYAYNTAFKNKTRIKENIDIRADGGYVVAVPSSNLKGEYKVIKRMTCQPFPINLFAETETGSSDYVKIETEYEGFGEGQRNSEMTRYIGHILAKVHPSEWEKIAWNIIQEANQKNTPPLSEFELKSIFNSIQNKEKVNPADRWYKKIGEERIDLIVKQDYKMRYTWGTRGLDVSLAIIKRGNFIIIAAKRNSGKTTFSFDMACKNALKGHKVLYISLEMEEDKIKEDFARKYSGITIAEELDYEIPDFKKCAFEKKIMIINSIKKLFFRGMRRGDVVGWDAIVKIINEFTDLDLIFIDNLDLIEGEKGESDIERQKRITKKIMGLTAEKQIPIVLIHHHRKSKEGKDFGADEMAGSGKIGDNADIILKITKNSEPDALYPEKYKSTIKQQKGRGYPEVAKYVFFIKGTFVDFAPSEEEYYGTKKTNDEDDDKIKMIQESFNL